MQEKIDGEKGAVQKKVAIIPDGPYMVQGAIPLYKEIIGADELGIALQWRVEKRYPDREAYLLCRCGKSKKKPYCDGTHTAENFKGTETARRSHPLETAEKTDGPGLLLNDIRELCANARFCDRAGGTWNLTKHSDDPRARKIAVQESCDCPSGRLVMFDKKENRIIEPPLGQSISVVEDPSAEAGGPLWVKGGIRIESEDGTPYEQRNRVTLCRCGGSHNMPFCDGRHVEIGFKGEID
jgi:CDGSH-type Zn-finger protein